VAWQALRHVCPRNLEEPRVKGACGTRAARGCAAQGVPRDETQARRRGSRVGKKTEWSGALEAPRCRTFGLTVGAPHGSTHCCELRVSHEVYACTDLFWPSDLSCVRLRSRQLVVVCAAIHPDQQWAQERHTFLTL
jgi:hypothetical protein